MKRLYNRLPSWLRFVVWMPALARVWGPTTLRDLVRLRPFATWRNYGSERGMNAWRDFIDWVGGYPFEVAKPEEVFDFCHQRGLTLTYLKTCGGGLACNEFVFANPPACAQS
jgi:2-polyprenyl-6-hydroxyphenyl methylase/3-demethylubiquinone-9 3-methyltransferase